MTFFKDVKSLVASIEGLGYLFMEESKELLVLDTKDIACPEALRTLCEVEVVGRGGWTAGRKASWVLSTQFRMWASLTVDCRGVKISLIWKLSNDKSVRLRCFVKIACYCCIVAILTLICVLVYQVYLFLNCMGRAVILAL